MPIYQKATSEVIELARELIAEFPDHKPLAEAKVKIDFVFAYASQDDQGNVLGCALKHHGCRALGIARKLSPKDRAMGRGDAEIALDGDWWKDASEGERRALLDHELLHIAVKRDASGTAKTDDLGRPIIYMRPHDHEFGWFNVVAARHGQESQERIQARKMMEQVGQYYWPEMLATDEVKIAEVA